MESRFEAAPNAEFFNKIGDERTTIPSSGTAEMVRIPVMGGNVLVFHTRSARYREKQTFPGANYQERTCGTQSARNAI